MFVEIYQSDTKVLYFYDHELFKVELKQAKLYKLSFEEFIREVDICPDENIDWKRKTIIRFAEMVGMINE